MKRPFLLVFIVIMTVSHLEPACNKKSSGPDDRNSDNSENEVIAFDSDRMGSGDIM